MKILICAVQFKGGSLQVAISLIKEFIKFPENQYFVIQSREVQKQLEGSGFPSNFHFYNLPYPSKIRLLNLVLRRRFLRDVENKISPDGVICTSGPLYWRPKSPLLMGYNLAHHLYPESSYFKRIPLWKRLRWHLRWAVHKHCYRKESAAIFVQTEDINDRLRKALKFDKIYTISNTYNDAYNHPQRYPDKLPERKPGEFRLLTLSAFYMHKNFEIIPKVIDELQKRDENNIRFVVTLPEDKYSRVFGSKYKDFIWNVGFVPTKEGPSLYQECDVMFLPTLLECFSASYAEAMVMRRPIMTSDLGFAHTVCKDAAIYLNPDNAAEIAEKIMALKQDKALQQSLINKGCEQMKQFGSAEDRAVRILELSREICKK